MERVTSKYELDRMIVSQRVFHCDPVFPIVKEAKEGWDLMVWLMKEATSNAV
jgi:hypothetical protein